MAEKKNIRTSILLKVRLTFLLVLLLGIAVVVKIFLLSTVLKEKYVEVYKKRVTKDAPVLPVRGNIYAGDGESLLATSVPEYTLAFDPTEPDSLDKRPEELDSLCRNLSEYFKEKSPEDYRQTILEARRNGRHYLLISNKKFGLMDKLKMERWPVLRLRKYKNGRIFNEDTLRKKPYGDLAGRTVGYTLASGKRVGIESSFNDILSGKEGIGLYKNIGNGNYRLENVIQEPKNANDVVTTIDINLQDVAESALRRELLKNQAEKGCVVLMEVSTGEIKAIANLGKTSQGNYAEIYNYAIGEKAEPGSTMKLASYMALIQAGAINPTDSVDLEGGKKEFRGQLMQDAHVDNTRKSRKSTITEAFAHSSNVGVSKLIDHHFKSQPEKFIDYLDQFGLSERLKIEVEGYKAPNIKRPNDKNWNKNSLPWMSIGYELEVTPIQTLAFYNAVANNGVMVKPTLIKGIREGSKWIEKKKPEILRKQICDTLTISKVRKMLEAVVEFGTANNVKHPEYKIAGKTGTSKKLEGGRYVEKYYASFAGYFPAEKPKYSCIVVIDSPKGYNTHGRDVAAPVFKELASKIHARDTEMHKELKESKENEDIIPNTFAKAGNYYDLVATTNRFGISNSGNDGLEQFVYAENQKNFIKWRPIKSQSTATPNTIGMTLKDALFLLESRGFRVSVSSGKGKVVRSDPSPGALYDRNFKHVRLWLD